MRLAMSLGVPFSALGMMDGICIFCVDDDDDEREDMDETA